MKLKNAEEFSAVFNFKKRLSSPHIYFHYVPNSRLHPRLGFIISNKIEKLSVRRNYMRRLLREILKQQLSAEAPFDIIVRVHKAFSRKNINQIDKEVRNLIKGLPS